MNWVKWLYPGMKLKRWLFLFSLGVMVCALGLAMLFNYQVISVLEEAIFRLLYQATGRYSVTTLMLAGGAILLLGLLAMVFATRRLVQSMVQALIPDSREKLVERLFAMRKRDKGPAVVVVGGGTGLSVLLRGMKFLTANCTAVVTTADDGGSSGRLREELGIIPPGDLRNCLVALADTEPLMEKLMQHRFGGSSSLGGHSFGNLFIAAMAQVVGDMEQGLKATSKVLKVRGQVLPSTLASVKLEATLADGVRVVGESNIPELGQKIVKVELLPSDPPAVASSVAAIEKADLLVFGPGSLYTSIIPNLLVPGIREAVMKSQAVRIYICNVMTQPGETDDYTAADHLQAIIDHVGGNPIDYVLVNRQMVAQGLQEKYAGQAAFPVEVDTARIEAMGSQVVEADLISQTDLVRHDPVKLAQAVWGLVYRLGLKGGIKLFDYYYIRQAMRNMRTIRRRGN